jgi:hypothetical protein
MTDRIHPRPIFRRAMSMLEDARCPECGRAFDPVQDAETDCHRMVPLHCAWCAQRQILIQEFRAWQRQDSEVLRGRKNSLR